MEETKFFDALERDALRDGRYLGRDFFRPHHDYEYAEAYASIGRIKHLLGQDAEWIADLLEAEALPGPSWGLPWPWRLYGSGEEVTQGFVVTTVQVLHFLLDLGREPDLTWLVENARRYTESSDDIVWNAVSQAAGLLGRVGHEMASELVEDVLRGRYVDLWPYSLSKPYTFEQHQAMTLEGLILAGVDHDVIARSLDAAWRELFLVNGTARIRVGTTQRMQAQHAMLHAWCHHAIGDGERAELISERILEDYVEDDCILITPNGGYYLRPAAGAILSLLRMR